MSVVAHPRQIAGLPVAGMGSGLPDWRKLKRRGLELEQKRRVAFV